MEIRHAICEKRTYSRVPVTHDHTFGQLLFPLKGDMKVKTDHNCFHLKEDTIFFIPFHCMHTFHSFTANEFLVLDVPKHFLNEGIIVESSEPIQLNLDYKWKSLRFLLMEEVHRLKGKSASSLDQLSRYIVKKLPDASHPSIEYIHNHFAEPISVYRLAELEHYHPVYFTEWFKKKTGKTPGTYIQEIRINESKKLLEETDWSISMIAHYVGYDHLSSFTRTFVKFTGTTPTQYRKQLKES
ncbi:MAG: helix-turn-helix transcriptional regulator [Bacillaceae bacterium]|nr:helix-turn-helix transcriptional regulator [Bacillaceae bacterium]